MRDGRIWCDVVFSSCERPGFRSQVGGKETCHRFLRWLVSASGCRALVRLWRATLKTGDNTSDQEVNTVVCRVNGAKMVHSLEEDRSKSKGGGRRGKSSHQLRDRACPPVKVNKNGGLIGGELRRPVKSAASWRLLLPAGEACRLRRVVQKDGTL